MKRIILLMLLTTLGCQNQNSVTACDNELLNKVTTFAINQEQDVSCQDGTKLIFIRFEESRCPVNVNCIRAGNVNAFFELRKDGQTTPFMMCLGECNTGAKLSEQDTKTVAVGSHRYEIILKEVSPFPGTKPDIKTADYQVKVEMKRDMK